MGDEQADPLRGRGVVDVEEEKKWAACLQGRAYVVEGHGGGHAPWK